MSYFQERIVNRLGIPSDHLNIEVDVRDLYDIPRPITTWPVCYENDSQGTYQEGGISFPYVTLSGLVVNADQSKTQNRPRPFELTRLTPEQADKYQQDHGQEKKTHIPKGAGTWPFFPPNLYRQFHAGETLETLVITEGYIKALYADYCGIPTIGLSSITHYRESGKHAMYDDVIRLINAMQPNNIVIVWDGDCLDVSNKDLADGAELTKRPHIFISSTFSIYHLLKEAANNTDIYFAHPHTHLEKGIDDLLLAHPDEADTIKKEVLHNGAPGSWLHKQPLGGSAKKLRQHFCVDDVHAFYNLHKEAIGSDLFVMNGSQYRYNQENDECELIIPADAKRYALIGDYYFEFKKKPDGRGDYIEMRDQIQESTIVKRHAKKSDPKAKQIIDNIPIYLDFCIIPSHENYVEHKDNFFNLYRPVPWVPEKGDCPNTLKFLEHIFGDHYEIGLDYLTILWKYPTIRPNVNLPVPCFVSKEGETGKDTFAKWLKYVFRDNMITLGNKEISGNFNSIFADKLIIAVNEALSEKGQVVEEVKRLQTDDKIILNTKNIKETELPFFGNFMFFSNNILNFLKIDPHERRFWVIEVPVPQEKDPYLPGKMKGEVNAFLNYLSERQMKYPEPETQLWFPQHEYVTNALKRVQESSRPDADQAIIETVREVMLTNLKLEFTTSIKHFHEAVNNISKYKYNRRHMTNYLRSIFGVEEVSKRYEQYMTWNSDAEQFVEQEEPGRGKQMRGFTFQAKDFLTDDEIKMIKEASNGHGQTNNISEDYWQRGKDIERKRQGVDDNMPF